MKSHQKPDNRTSARLFSLMLVLVLVLSLVPAAVFAADSYTSVAKGSVSWTMINQNPDTFYVKTIDPAEVNTGDIIAFEGGDSVIMHRVQENKVVEGSFVTKGDANDSEDLAEVPYDRLIGIVVRHIPILGQILTLFGTSFGRICMVCFAACGALLNILGGRLRDALKYAREEET